MNSIKRPAVLIYFVLILFVFAGCAPEKSPPVAEKGRLDLSGWDFQTQGALPLDGEWEFYWENLLTPSDFVSGGSPEKTGYMYLPGLWKGSLNGTDLSAYGCATYRLVVKVKPGAGLKAMLIRNPLSVCKVWVNGTAVAESGLIGESRDTELPRRHMMIPRFPAAGDRLEIILQVSNHANIEGGLNVPIWFGAEQDIQLITNRKLIMVAVLGGALFVMAFYHLVLFFVRRSEPANLYVGLYCLMWSTTTVFGEMGVCLMATLIPDLPWRTTIDFSLLPHGLAVPLMVMFYHALFPRSRSIIIERFYQVIGAGFILYIVATPPNAFGFFPFVYYLVSLSVFPYLFIRFAVDFIRREEGALLLIPGYLILALSGINDKLYDLHIVNTTLMVPYGSFIFILFHSLLISTRFSRTFTAVEELSHELEENNIALLRLVKIKDEAYTTLEENLRLKKELSLREKTEQELRLTQRRLSGMMDTVDDAMLAINEGKEISFCNRSFESLTGLKAETLLGQPYLSVFNNGNTDALKPVRYAIEENSPERGAPRSYEIIPVKKAGGGEMMMNFHLTLLELEGETLHMLVLRNSSLAGGRETASLPAIRLVEKLNRNRQRVQSLEDSLTDIIGKNDIYPQIKGDLREVDNLLDDLAGHINSNGIDKKRDLAVSVMNLSLDYWVASTRLSKIELAERSCLWNIYIEKDGFARTQTLDKYLIDETMPKKPRWKQVVNTADFVLSTCVSQSALREQLEDVLSELRLSI